MGVSQNQTVEVVSRDLIIRPNRQRAAFGSVLAAYHSSNHLAH